MYLGVNGFLDRLKVVKSVLKLKGPAHQLLFKNILKILAVLELDYSLSDFAKHVCEKSGQCVSVCISHFVHLTR